MTPRTRQALEFVLDNLVWFMLVFVLVVFSIFIPNYFQLGIFANIIEASSVLGVMSIGLALVIIAGHMDLSVESVAALSAMAVGILFCSSGIGLGVQLHPEWLMVPVSLLLAVAVGGLIGACNGYLVVRVKMVAQEVDNLTRTTLEHMTQLVEVGDHQIVRIKGANGEVEHMANLNRQVTERARVL